MIEFIKANGAKVTIQKLTITSLYLCGTIKNIFSLWPYFLAQIEKPLEFPE